MLTWHRIHPNTSHPSVAIVWQGRLLRSKLIHHIDFPFGGPSFPWRPHPKVSSAGNMSLPPKNSGISGWRTDRTVSRISSSCAATITEFFLTDSIKFMILINSFQTKLIPINFKMYDCNSSANAVSPEQIGETSGAVL